MARLFLYLQPFLITVMFWFERTLNCHAYVISLLSRKGFEFYANFRQM